MRTIEDLLTDVEREAERLEFPIDREVYAKAGKNPLKPILFAGALDGRVCFLGRDLGKDEVAAGQPLIGAGGRLIRSGVFEARTGAPPDRSDRRVESILSSVLLTNTVPYKPPGNKAYSDAIKARFRPFAAELLVAHWTGSVVIPLGTEAFQWFAPYAAPGALDEFWASDDRYEKELTVDVDAMVEGARRSRSITIAPLPHPSPLNRRWLPVLPELLQKRLAGRV